MYSIHTIVGSELFKHLYVRDKRGGKEFDALGNGEDACAYVVSGVLALNGLIDHPHAMVTTTIARMLELGWIKTSKPQSADVVQWAAHNDNMHMAFMIEDGMCIGNSTKYGVPMRYGTTLDDGREPIAYFTHPSLHAD